MPTPLGVHSPQLDAVRALRAKRGRSEQARFAVEGPTLLAEALAAGRRPEAVYVTDRTLAAPSLAGLPGDIPLFVVPERAMERLSDLETPSGIIAVFPLALDPPDRVLQGARAVVLLAGIADPGNAGSLLRSAEIFGIERALFAQGGIEPHNPKVVRATMGALFRMRIGTVRAEEVGPAAARHGLTVVAASTEGVPLPAFRFPARPLIAIGNERRGVGGWLPAWDHSVAIPQRGGGESLNAAVAGAIIFYEFSQQVSR